MSNQSNESYLKIAIAAAKKSGKIFLQYFGRPKSVKIKDNDPRNLVTEIDHKIEILIRKTIHKNFPRHKIIGEEFGSHKLNKNDFVWIIDPVDGTTNYIHGLPLCCISIGLWQNNIPLVGVIYSPVANHLYYATKAQGAFLDGKKIKVSGNTNLGLAFGGFGWGRNIEKAKVNFPKLVHILHKIRTLGSATYELCCVASGIYDFYIQSEINAWDFAAGALIVKEAGGEITQIDGKPLTLNSKSFVTSNKKIHSQIIKDLKKALIV